MNKNLGLSEKQFYDLVEELKNGNNKLFELAFNKLVFYNIRYAKRKYRISEFDAKDATINALYSLRNKLIDDKIKYSNIRFLFTKMVYHEYLLIRKRNENIVYLDTATENNLVDSTDSFTDENFNKLNTAMKKLDSKCVELLESIYSKNAKLNKLADKFGISYDLIRKRKQRCLDKLRSIVKTLYYPEY